MFEYMKIYKHAYLYIHMSMRYYIYDFWIMNDMKVNGIYIESKTQIY